MFQIIKYQPEYQKQWDEFVDKSKNATFLFKRDFMEYHADRFEDFSLLVYKQEKLVGLFPACIQNGVIYSHLGLSYGGFLVKKNIETSIFIQLVKSVLAYYHQAGITQMELKLLPLFYQSQISQELDYVLFLLQAQLVRRDSYFAMKSQPYQPNRNRKRALRKASEMGIVVQKTNDYTTFWDRILTPNLNHRFGVNPVHTLEEILHLQRKFPDNIHLYGAFLGQEMQAGAVVFVTQTTAHFQYSSGKEERDSGALDALFDYIIRAYQHKKYISFGSSSQRQGLELNTGLAYWKESFGAQCLVQSFYQINTAHHLNLNEVLV